MRRPDTADDVLRAMITLAPGSCRRLLTRSSVGYINHEAHANIFVDRWWKLSTKAVWLIPLRRCSEKNKLLEETGLFLGVIRKIESHSLKPLTLYSVPWLLFSPRHHR